MSPLIKAALIPFVRIFQFVLAILLIALFIGLAYGISVYETMLWQCSWKGAVGIHVVVCYVVAVIYCRGTNAKWWPE